MRRAMALLALLAGCAAPPEIDVERFAGRIPPARPGSPALLPIEAVLAAPPPRAEPAPPRAEVEDRAAALRARAAALSGPVIPATDRDRLEEARGMAPAPGGAPTAGGAPAEDRVAPPPPTR